MKWLAHLPSTNALVMTSISLAMMTGLRYVLSHCWVPDGNWLTFVAGFATVATLHFSAKRVTQHKPGPGVPDADGTAGNGLN